MSVKSAFRLNSLVTTAAFALAAIAAAVFYGMAPDLGKSTACSASSLARAQRLKDLAGNDLPALTIKPHLPPPLAFKGPDGSPLTLANFSGRGLALNLWATWCVPCRVEMPDLDKLQAAAGDKDFEVVAVAVDTARPERVPAFLNAIGVKSLTRYTDFSGDMLEKLRLSGDALGLPTTVLIDKEGCQLGVVAGAAKWDSPTALAAAKALAGS